MDDSNQSQDNSQASDISQSQRAADDHDEVDRNSQSFHAGSGGTGTGSVASEKNIIDLGADGLTDQNGQHHPIPEFLYQLTKMLTDDNSEIIEWQDGRIKVHHPERLEVEVLARYFRHSKFASFQRQLNYFGFRKIAGKGKMSPCSYVNEGATNDIRSLLLIKRKTNGSAARKAAMQQRSALTNVNLNPTLLGMNLCSLAAAGQAGVAGLNGLPNAMSLLSENALRAGLGQLQMQAQQQQQQNNNVLGTAQLNFLMLQQQLQQQQQQQQLMQQQQQLVHSFSHDKLLTQDQQQQQQQQQQLLGQNSLSQGGGNQGGYNPSTLSQSVLGQNTLNQINMTQGGLAQNMLSQGLSSGFTASQMKDLQSNQQSSFPKTSSLEQLQAQLAASLAASQQQQHHYQQQQQQQQQAQQQQVQQQLQRQLQQQNQAFNFGSLTSAGMNASSNPTSALKLLSFGNQNSGLNSNPASAALLAAQKNSKPATAAMDAAYATAPTSLFESAVNLGSLLQEHQESANRGNTAVAAAANVASQALLNRLPSSSAIFPDTMSTASFGHLLSSSNRLNSLVSLNSFVGSRETSLADFANLSAQLAANNNNNAAQQIHAHATTSADIARLRN